MTTKKKKKQEHDRFSGKIGSRKMTGGLYWADGKQALQQQVFPCQTPNAHGRQTQRFSNPEKTQ